MSYNVNHYKQRFVVRKSDDLPSLLSFVNVV